jgi:hypothetical protein
VILVDLAEEAKLVVAVPSWDEVTETGVVLQGRSIVTVLVHPHLRELSPCVKFGIRGSRACAVLELKYH